MSTRDLLLVDLYHTQRDPQAQALAVRHAPALYFDTREPFLPLAAGYTIFTADGLSSSFNRIIELRPEDLPPAALAIEYAIWWDWDIHHLYELEHVWVYIGDNGEPVRVEGSWHGKFYEMTPLVEGGRIALLSEPGKHALAPHPSWFAERAGQYRRVETRFVGAHAGVLVNQLFAGKIRQRVFDATLARSYLYQRAFKPAWDFSNRFYFSADSLVPWPVLEEWIPRRMNAWLERLETSIRPVDYRSLRLTSIEPSLDALQSAARSGADMIVLSLSIENNRLALGQSLDLEEALQYCQEEPMGAFIEPQDEETVDRLTWFVRSNELQSHVVITSANASLISHYKSYVPEGKAVIQLLAPDQDPLALARASDATFVNPRWEQFPDRMERLTPDWIANVHEAGLGILSWPVDRVEEAEALQKLGVDAIWFASTQLLELHPPVR